MDLIWVIIFGIVGIFAAALSKQLTDEIKAWTPWIIELLIHAAVAKLPESERDRLHEEWHSDIRDTPGELGKLVVAVGFVLAALKISHDIGNDFRTNLFAEKTKRVLDMGIGVAAFVFVLPLLLLVWFAVYSDGRGPAFVFDERVGAKGRLIRLLRFRTRSHGGALDWTPDSALLKKFTRVGRVIWVLSIDYLPYLISVFRGDLSLVGPTPKPPQYFKFLCEMFPDYHKVIGVKPGLTGWAQVHFAYYGLDETNFLSNTNIVKMVEYDLYYMKNRNLRMDLGILMWTLLIILMPRKKQRA